MTVDKNRVIKEYFCGFQPTPEEVASCAALAEVASLPLREAVLALGRKLGGQRGALEMELRTALEEAEGYDAERHAAAEQGEPDGETWERWEWQRRALDRAGRIRPLLGQFGFTDRSVNPKGVALPPLPPRVLLRALEALLGAMPSCELEFGDAVLTSRHICGDPGMIHSCTPCDAKDEQDFCEALMRLALCSAPPEKVAAVQAVIDAAWPESDS